MYPARSIYRSKGYCDSELRNIKLDGAASAAKGAHKAAEERRDNLSSCGLPL